MPELFSKLFSSDFMPHGMCYLWNPGVLWLNVASDALIAASYYAIPFLLFRFARNRRDITFKWIFVAFGMFILACGTTHLMAVWTVWHATYWLDGVVKAITAVSSVATAVLLVPLIPLLVRLPSPTELARLNRALAGEIEEHKAAQDEIQRINAHLEQRIAERTAELRASNEQLRESVERYRFLADAMPQMVWTARPDGWLDYYNQRWYEYTGMTFEQAQGWGWQPTVHPDDRQPCIDGWSQSVRTGEFYQIEYRFRRASDGTYRWHLGRGMPRRNQKGEIVQWVGTSTDVDDLKRTTESLEQANSELREEVAHSRRLEDRLAHSQKMEAVGRLAGGVAHDFNNLLTGISGFADILQEELDKQPHLRSYAEEIQGAAGRAASLTHQLLAFSRRQETQPKIIDLNEVVEGVERMLRRVIGEDVELITRPAPHLETVKADRGQMDQIIVNLAVNSRDAMPNGGRLMIETANVELGSQPEKGFIGVPPGRYVMLAVSDTGSGIDEETRRHLFEPFFTTKETGRGTGLGLSIVYGIVRQHGGEISLYSEPGHGATFKIYLPVCAEPDEKARETLVHPETRGTETVLVVEDEEVVRTYANAVLEKQGYRVLAAPGPRQALELAASYQGPINLLLTDVVMPEMNGPDLARELAAREPGLKVLFMSAYPHGYISGQSLLDPGAAYIQKPFTAALLHRKIREVLEDGAPAGPEGS